MKKIGLIGEAPNDTNSFINLFSNHCSEKGYFVNLINDIHGSMLENQKTKHLLRKEYESHKPDFVVFIRDLDGLETDIDQVDRRKAYFTEFNSVIDKKGIYLLNIFEIEALILADIEAFNDLYNCQIEF
nr:hypothetical protein [Flavobacteriales bacterium]